MRSPFHGALRRCIKESVRSKNDQHFNLPLSHNLKSKNKIRRYEDISEYNESSYYFLINQNMLIT